ncbi:chorismate synthase [Prochlorococcus marinus]|uniref:Chorismate synthase n=1 Tax=Prochlorococcus marinus (strain MIT 9211) TaxID=93059 RepID=AROC_PROM4|nr:chorismate synthase [Prochlorococcus marinus]A9BDJ2.1 RecName: Full=Chorismate synthase; Short=CS; AltName: Full=5-enolpyruvylshikimate-3-phosphate phospholyase [Prochlorococcus marinus str. MIT 9211]ABX08178.1 Chorismate synthase [Prochlorococcus marinus str. MIT 9211]
MGSSFGDLFRISTFGESHGGGVGVILEGCPPRLAIDVDAIQAELDRRRPGQSKITTPRNEVDQVEILSGLVDNKTLGTPISMVVRNKDFRPNDYGEMQNIFRPSHADGTYHLKYGVQAASGGGRASARETIGRVAAGAIAKQLLRKVNQTEVLAWVKRIHTIEADVDPNSVQIKDIESNIVRCPDPKIAKLMVERIEEVSRDGDSCGGVIECIVRNPPAGLGMPVFDKLEADLAKALMSLPASKGFEIGSGFSGTFLKGSEHNDAFIPSGKGILRTATNNSGGIQGGISNGELIVLRVAFKPTATIRKDQKTVDSDGKERTLSAKGRHDPCVLPRAVPMVESMVALVLADHLLRQQGQCGLWQ